MKKILVFLVVAYMFCPQEAYAYLDPGTGSMIIQTIIAAVVGAGVYFSAFFNKIFKKKNKDE